MHDGLESFAPIVCVSFSFAFVLSFSSIWKFTVIYCCHHRNDNFFRTELRFIAIRWHSFEKEKKNTNNYYLHTASGGFCFVCCFFWYRDSWFTSSMIVSLNTFHCQFAYAQKLRIYSAHKLIPHFIKLNENNNITSTS